MEPRGPSRPAGLGGLCGSGRDGTPSASAVPGHWLRIRAASIPTVLQAFPRLGQSRTPDRGSVDSDPGHHDERVRSAGVLVVGRVGWRLVPVTPRPVAAARPATGGGVHRLLHQLRRRPVRLGAAATAIAARDPVRDPVPRRCQPHPHHTAIDQTTVGPSRGRRRHRLAAGPLGAGLAGPTARRRLDHLTAGFPRLRDRLPARRPRRNRMGQRIPA